jgi:hypothetical protein
MTITPCSLIASSILLGLLSLSVDSNKKRVFSRIEIFLLAKNEFVRPNLSMWNLNREIHISHPDDLGKRGLVSPLMTGRWASTPQA